MALEQSELAKMAEDVAIGIDEDPDLPEFKHITDVMRSSVGQEYFSGDDAACFWAKTEKGWVVVSFTNLDPSRIEEAEELIE